ncbi:MAG: biotin-dependent carboxyltransferase family protein [Lewinellaceae bacterium]|nr:biotin-dependent carboxyltransferase family protein [Lewinellaceae bacterium]
MLMLKTGLQDTVQDAGRWGYAHLGIHAAGAADPVALRVANLLAGNPPETAALEMHFPAPHLRFEQPALFALAGADFRAVLDGQEVPVGAPALASAGSTLVFRQQARGVRVYLGVQGGFALEPWLGSNSTDLLAGVGGLHGQALRAGDRLPFRQTLSETPPGNKNFSWRARVSDLYPADSVFRFLPGPEYNLLDDASREQLETTEWRLSRQSNRMAGAVEGPALTLREHYELVSSAVLPGTVQLLPDGTLLLLLADCQTTGGYPRVAQVLSADLPGLAQNRPGDGFYFCLAQIEEAAAAARRQRMLLRRLGIGCAAALSQPYSTPLNNPHHDH